MPIGHVTYDELTTFVFGDGQEPNPDPTPTVIDPADFVDRVIVDGTAGSDTLGYGVEWAPFKTINGALLATEGDIHIIVNHGTYAERVIITKGRKIWITGRGIFQLDGQNQRSVCGVENGNTTTPGGVLILENVHLIRPAPNGFLIQPKTGIGTSGAGLSDGVIVLANCVAYSTEVSTTGRLAYVRNANGFVLDVRACTLKNLVQAVDDGTPTAGGNNTDCALIFRNALMDVTSPFHMFCTSSHEAADDGTGLSPVASPHIALSVSGCAFKDQTAYSEVSPGIDTLVTAPVYKHSTFDADLDLSLDETSTAMFELYNESGDHNGLIGSTFYPRYGFNWATSVGEFGTGVASVSAWKDAQSLGDWITNPDYPDGSTKGEFIRQEVTESTVAALTIGDGWSIQDGKLSAELLGPVFKVPIRDGQADVSGYSMQVEFDGDITVQTFIRFSTNYQPFSQTLAEVSLPFTEFDKGEPGIGAPSDHDMYGQMKIRATVTP